MRSASLVSDVNAASDPSLHLSVIMGNRSKLYHETRLFSSNQAVRLSFRAFPRHPSGLRGDSLDIRPRHIKDGLIRNPTTDWCDNEKRDRSNISLRRL